MTQSTKYKTAIERLTDAQSMICEALSMLKDTEYNTKEQNNLQVFCEDLSSNIDDIQALYEEQDYQEKRILLFQTIAKCKSEIEQKFTEAKEHFCAIADTDEHENVNYLLNRMNEISQTKVV